MGLIFSATCKSEARLDGKTAVITGANSGIGKETAKDFYVRGAKVILACRNITTANEAIADIQMQCVDKENLGELLSVELDLSRFESVRSCAKELLKNEKEINILVNNAGVFAIPYHKTDDGYELTLQTNHLSPFLFTLLLMPVLLTSTPVRIINVSSLMHKALPWGYTLSDINMDENKFKSIQAYSQSKLFNILFTKELARQLKENKIEDITVYSLHPGVVRTNVGRNLDQTYFRGCSFLFTYLFGIIFKNSQQGAQTQIYCAVDENCANETGLYYVECKPCEPSENAKNEPLAKELWNKSFKYVGLNENNNPFIQQ